MANKREPALAFLKSNEYGQFFTVNANHIAAFKTLKEGDFVSLNKLREPTQYGATHTLSRKPGRPKVATPTTDNTDEF